VSVQTNAILACNKKPSTCYLVIQYYLLAKWIRKYGRNFTYITKFGMNPHQDTWTGDDAMTTLE